MCWLPAAGAAGIETPFAGHKRCTARPAGKLTSARDAHVMICASRMQEQTARTDCTGNCFFMKSTSTGRRSCRLASCRSNEFFRNESAAFLLLVLLDTRRTLADCARRKIFVFYISGPPRFACICIGKLSIRRPGEFTVETGLSHSITSISLAGQSPPGEMPLLTGI